MTKVITRMQEITLEVNNKLDVIQRESVNVGSLLREALDIMKDEGKKQADFLAYCKDEFSIGKAQAYKLMKVSEVFADDGRFKGVAMRVLYALATQANDEQLERAADFAASGTLSTAVVNQLLNPEPPKQQEPEQPPELTPEQVTEQQNAIEEALKNVSQCETEDEPPFDSSVTAQMAANDAQQEANKPANDEYLAEIKELKEALKAANDLIKEMKERSESKQANAPYLPQFDNACPYAVLGLGQVEAKQITKVKKAFRDLIKCGYGEGHKAFDKLTTARDQLLADIEAAKKA